MSMTVRMFDHLVGSISSCARGGPHAGRNTTIPTGQRRSCRHPSILSPTPIECRHATRCRRHLLLLPENYSEHAGGRTEAPWAGSRERRAPGRSDTRVGSRQATNTPLAVEEANLGGQKVDFLGSACGCIARRSASDRVAALEYYAFRQAAAGALQRRDATAEGEQAAGCTAVHTGGSVARLPSTSATDIAGPSSRDPHVVWQPAGKGTTAAARSALRSADCTAGTMCCTMCCACTAVTICGVKWCSNDPRPVGAAGQG